MLDKILILYLARFCLNIREWQFAEFSLEFVYQNILVPKFA
jgi:hypothetical protein